ncbi:hypothetical protein J40TS1_35870 [Paenibacillus montaniterrae]|uniref:Uncharacterized protein n=2 Tax=Paenibacillus montaniterrae TaxID=429341 RepID=A0A920CZ04_9BACL|nr:hypothetical protein J40TS1_35870 [Paenibacillus montaniterrae]
MTNATAGGTLTAWTDAAPYIPTGSFDPTTGVYTVPATAHYAIGATVNYSLPTAATGIAANVNPTLTIQSGATVLLTGTFPIFNTNAQGVDLRTILGNGTIVMTGDFALTSGETITMHYNDGGLTTPVDFGTGATNDGNGITWSIRQISQ